MSLRDGGLGRLVGADDALLCPYGTVDMGWACWLPTPAGLAVTSLQDGGFWQGCGVWGVEVTDALATDAVLLRPYGTVDVR
ncbi:hypothetical protein EQG79_15355 [Spirosoma sordidisoli]|uniref:Uncharacterized protein n=1 Tax=Spirosoma sordidisoli TaxID=2502893 RepID=A0A4Q2UPP7_9BACT|nr:hypothetical protein EQG79_15355 [Spirosoma sordidisoli]